MQHTPVRQGAHALSNTKSTGKELVKYLSCSQRTCKVPVKVPVGKSVKKKKNLWEKVSKQKYLQSTCRATQSTCKVPVGPKSTCQSTCRKKVPARGTCQSRCRVKSTYTRNPSKYCAPTYQKRSTCRADPQKKGGGEEMASPHPALYQFRMH